MTIICWEYPDGSSGECEVDDEFAYDTAMAVCSEHLEARVWVGSKMIQRGFIASDELGGA